MAISWMSVLNVIMAVGLFVITLVTIRDWQYVLALAPGTCPIITTDKQADIEMDLRSESCRSPRASKRPDVEHGEDPTHIELDELGWLFHKRAFGFVWILIHLITTHFHYFYFLLIFSGALDNSPVNAIVLLASACSLVLWVLLLVWMRRKAIVESVKQINPCKLFPIPLIETFTIPTIAIILATVFNLLKAMELDREATSQFSGRFRLGISYGLYFEYLVLLLGALDRIYKMRNTFLREKPPSPKRDVSYLSPGHLGVPGDPPGNVRFSGRVTTPPGRQDSSKEIVVNMKETDTPSAPPAYTEEPNNSEPKSDKPDSEPKIEFAKLGNSGEGSKATDQGAEVVPGAPGQQKSEEEAMKKQPTERMEEWWKDGKPDQAEPKKEADNNPESAPQSSAEDDVVKIAAPDPIVKSDAPEGPNRQSFIA